MYRRKVWVFIKFIAQFAQYLNSQRMEQRPIKYVCLCCFQDILSETKEVSKHYRAPWSASVTALGCFLHHRRVVIIILAIIIIISVKCVGNTITIIIVVVCKLKLVYFSLIKWNPSINTLKDWNVKNSRNKYDIYLDVWLPLFEIPSPSKSSSSSRMPSPSSSSSS